MAAGKGLNIAASPNDDFVIHVNPTTGVCTLNLIGPLEVLGAALSAYRAAATAETHQPIPAPTQPVRRPMTAATRKKLAEAARRRWAAKTPTPTPAAGNRRKPAEKPLAATA